MASNPLISIENELLQQESILQIINKTFVSISKVDRATYSKHLDTVLHALIKHMKGADELFACLYQTFTYTGSYPDKLKVGKPEEFDMNLVMKFKCAARECDIGENLEATDEPAFIKVNMKKVLVKMKESVHWVGCKSCRKVETWIDEQGYLLQTKVRQWMQGVLSKAFVSFHSSKQNPEMKELPLETDEIYKVKVNQHGPALTVTVLTPDDLKFEVDLVLAFGLEHPAWPPARQGQRDQIRKLPKGSEKKTWYIIPKPRGSNEGQDNRRKWRTSFQEQEGALLTGKHTLKPIIRLLKKMRTSANISTKDLSSYAIKTVVLWEMEKMEKEKKTDDFLKKPQGYLFVHMLACLMKFVEEGKIPYYWDKGGNLLDENRSTSQKSMLGHLQRIHKDIVNKIREDKYILAKKLLTSEEFSKFQEFENLLCSQPKTTATDIKLYVQIPVTSLPMTSTTNIKKPNAQSPMTSLPRTSTTDIKKLNAQSPVTSLPKTSTTDIKKLNAQSPVTSLPKTCTSDISVVANEVKELKELVAEHKLEMIKIKKELLENRAAIKLLEETVNILLTQWNISQHWREASSV